MSDTRTPLEHLIDQACGYSPDRWQKARDTVKLKCSKCGKWKIVERHKSDLKGTVTVIADCPECSQPGMFEDVTYWDADGKQILPYQSDR